MHCNTFLFNGVVVVVWRGGCDPCYAVGCG